MDNNIISTFTMEKPVPSIKLSVEALPESKIQEIALDGRETFYRPLTMSENLCKMATKIDFLAEEEGRSDDQEEDDNEEDEERKKKPFQNQQWPWEGIRNHLRQALTEMNVLFDVLTITHSKGPMKKDAVQPPQVEPGKYMMLDHAPKETPPLKLNLQVPAKKRGLNAAADILLIGEKRIKPATGDPLTEMDFHIQLLKLRKYWRVRRLGVKLMGDLSYRTAGSDFSHAGNFEVIKKTSEECDSPANLPSSALSTRESQSAFKVVVGADLRGSASIRLSIKRKEQYSNSIDLLDVVNTSGETGSLYPEWHNTLCCAQNVLFCRELFNILAKEAVQLKTGCTLTPFLVVGNRISASIFPDTDVVIEFVHKPPKDNSPSGLNSEFPNPIKTSPSHDIYCLKYAAMRLLLNTYEKQLNVPAPHPVCASFGLTRIQRKAPTRPMVFSEMQVVSEKCEMPLIEKLAMMAKHWELKHWVSDVIESLSGAIQDPYLQAFWSKVGTPTKTSVRISIMSAGYESCNKTLVEIFVGTDTVRVVQKDGRIIMLSTNLHHIRDYLLSLLCSHQLHTMQEVCQILGWTILHFSLHAGIGPRSALGNVGSIMAVSPVGNCTVSVRCWLDRDQTASSNPEKVRYEVHVQRSRGDSEGHMLMTHRSPNQASLNLEQNAIQDPKWFLLGGQWREVDWEKLFGKHFMQKFETLLILLKSDS